MHLQPMLEYPETEGGGEDIASWFWSFLHIRSWRLGSFLYETSKDDLGMIKPMRLSKSEASEKQALTTLVRTVVAGWRVETNGTANLGVGLYSPFRTILLDLLAIAERWNFIDSSLYPLATIKPEYSLSEANRSLSLE